LANNFVNKFKGNKVELGKVASWLGDSYRRDELISIFVDSIRM
jgi:hypothetical protein